PGRALAMALGAFELRADDPEVRQVLVECAWTLRADPQVLDAIEPLGAIADDPNLIEGLAPQARAKLGETLALTGERERAKAIFEAVLAREPDNAAALRGLSGLHAASGETVEAWTFKRKLAETAPDDDERFQMLVETADGFATKANRPELAVEVYEEARR